MPHFATVLAGPMVTPGEYPERIDHYRLLRTIEDRYGLVPLGESAAAEPIRDVWRPVTAPVTAASEQFSGTVTATVTSGAATRAPSLLS